MYRLTSIKHMLKDRFKILSIAIMGFWVFFIISVVIEGEDVKFIGGLLLMALLTGMGLYMATTFRDNNQPQSH